MDNDGCLKRSSSKDAGATVYLIEELGDARMRCDQLVRYIAEATKLVENSAQKDHIFEVAGHLVHAIPDTLFRLQKALQATALAAGRIDYEELKRVLKPEKVDQLERVLQDERIRQVQRQHSLVGNDTKEGQDDMTTLSTTEEQSRFEEGKPADPTQNMSEDDKAKWKKQKELHKDEFKKEAGKSDNEAKVDKALKKTKLKPAAKRFAPNGAGAVVFEDSKFTTGGGGVQAEKDAKQLKKLLDKAGLKTELQELRAVGKWRVHIKAAPKTATTDMQQFGSEEEVRKKFKSENPEISDADMDKIVSQWQKNKDEFKAAASLPWGLQPTAADWKSDSPKTAADWKVKTAVDWKTVEAADVNVGRLERMVSNTEKQLKEMKHSLGLYKRDPGKNKPQLENLAAAARSVISTARLGLRTMGHKVSSVEAAQKPGEEDLDWSKLTPLIKKCREAARTLKSGYGLLKKLNGEDLLHPYDLQEYVSLIKKLGDQADRFDGFIKNKTRFASDDKFKAARYEEGEDADKDNDGAPDNLSPEDETKWKAQKDKNKDKFKKKEAGKPSWAEQLRMMKANPPKLDKDGEYYTIQIFSPFLGKYYSEAEHANEAKAKGDLKEWQTDHKRLLKALQELASGKKKQASSPEQWDLASSILKKGLNHAAFKTITKTWKDVEKALDEAKKRSDSMQRIGVGSTEDPTFVTEIVMPALKKHVGNIEAVAEQVNKRLGGPGISW